MPVPSLTVEEFINYLKKSTLPTVLVEGPEDMTVYRWVEDKFGPTNASVLPCGGRLTLLELYKRRGEFPHLKTTFIADRDMWLFTAIPDQYEGIIWTTGYSIENDVIAGSSVEGMLSKNETQIFKTLLSEIIRWFAFEVEEFKSGRKAYVDVSLSRLIPLGTIMLSNAYLTSRGFREPESMLLEKLHADSRLKLRGKTLLQLLMRFLASPGRKPSYGHSHILEMGVKLGANIYVNRLSTEIARTLELSD